MIGVAARNEKCGTLHLHCDDLPLGSATIITADRESRSNHHASLTNAPISMSSTRAYFKSRNRIVQHESTFIYNISIFPRCSPSLVSFGRCDC